AEFESLKCAALKLAAAENFSEAIGLIDQAITLMHHTRNAWIELHASAEKYKDIDIALAAISKERKNIEAKQDEALLKQEWQQTKERVFSESQSLLLSQPSAAALPGYIDKLQVYNNRYAKHRHYFDLYGKDSGMEKKLEEKIAACNVDYAQYQAELKRQGIKTADNNTQLRINKSLAATRIALDCNNLRLATENLSHACELVRTITDPNNIEKGNNYRTPEVLYASFEVLKFQNEEIALHAQNEVSKITNLIVEESMLQTDSKRGKSCLYAEHLTMLEEVLESSLKENWYKFDSRDFPKSFIDKLINLIKSNIKTIGWTRYWQDWNKTKSIVSTWDSRGQKTFPLIEKCIVAEIERYTPITSTPVVFSVPVFPDRVLPPVAEEILQAEVVEDQLSNGAYAVRSVDQTSKPSAPVMRF
ncbi:MAG: hypothetical protein Q8K92_20125, partial [Leadbetterella sp.]|nr:hypothetical protein [Leadbetterella sp.]